MLIISIKLKMIIEAKREKRKNIKMRKFLIKLLFALAGRDWNNRIKGSFD